MGTMDAMRALVRGALVVVLVGCQGSTGAAGDASTDTSMDASSDATLDGYPDCYFTKCDGAAAYCDPGTRCSVNDLSCELCTCKQVGVDRHYALHCIGVCAGYCPNAADGGSD